MIVGRKALTKASLYNDTKRDHQVPEGPFPATTVALRVSSIPANLTLTIHLKFTALYDTVYVILDTVYNPYIFFFFFFLLFLNDCIGHMLFVSAYQKFLRASRALQFHDSDSKQHYQ